MENRTNGENLDRRWSNIDVFKQIRDFRFVPAVTRFLLGRDVATERDEQKSFGKKERTPRNAIDSRPTYLGSYFIWDDVTVYLIKG